MHRWRTTLVALVLSGCASMAETPPQAYVWELGRACNSTTLSMERVEPDGRYTVRGASNVISFTPYFDCMKEQANSRPYREWLKQRQNSKP
jgi:hypothetical protein